MSTTNGYYPSPIKTRLSDSEPVPKGWKWVDLRDVARLESGHTPSRKVAEYWEGGDVPWVSLKDIRGMTSRYVMDTIDKPTMLGVDNSSARVLPKGTVAFCRTASVGNVAILGRDMATSQDFVDWVCGPQLLPEFLYEAFKASGPTFTNEMQGSTHKTIYMPTVERFKILLPPLLEQKRIADILDKADAIRRKRQEEGIICRKLQLSAFYEFFGNPATNPKEWETSELASLADKFSDGPFGSNLKSAHYVDSGVRVIRLQNIGVGEFIDADKAYVTEEHFESLPRHDCRPGDVIIGTLGDPNLRACILPESVPQALNKADCLQLRPHPKKATAAYVCWLLNSPSTLGMASGLVHGQTRSRISMGQLKQLTVPIPPLPLQKKFSEFVAKVDASVDHLDKASEEVDGLFNALVQRAFKGEL